MNRQIKKSTGFAFAILVWVLAAAAARTFSQVGQHKPEKILPTQTGHSLLTETMDLRKHISSEREITNRNSKGVICLIRGGVLAGGIVDEYPTNEWRTVEDALKSLRLLDRTTRRPQIRIVQCDSIVQSSMDLLDGTASGYSASFLATKLRPGDIVILTPISN